ncbi:hypothetical protein DFP72DRAFT_1052818 [Ephemerocybe angulata]|uniref:Uncharacterized protein n=1 Tax=Ephemerocybe angulata TaxID=980116 RepID=A0A8H6HAR0_9AGAR|nr:hypothetical protein DFP72DRAFT_1052818 [Tulosesus angulatus]
MCTERWWEFLEEVEQLAGHELVSRCSKHRIITVVHLVTLWLQSEVSNANHAEPIVHPEMRLVNANAGLTIPGLGVSSHEVHRDLRIERPHGCAHSRRVLSAIRSEQETKKWASNRPDPEQGSSRTNPGAPNSNNQNQKRTITRTHHASKHPLILSSPYSFQNNMLLPSKPDPNSPPSPPAYTSPSYSSPPPYPPAPSPPTPASISPADALPAPPAEEIPAATAPTPPVEAQLKESSQPAPTHSTKPTQPL